MDFAWELVQYVSHFCASTAPPDLNLCNHNHCSRIVFPRVLFQCVSSVFASFQLQIHIGHISTCASFDGAPTSLDAFQLWSHRRYKDGLILYALLSHPYFYFEICTSYIWNLKRRELFSCGCLVFVWRGSWNHKNRISNQVLIHALIWYAFQNMLQNCKHYCIDDTHALQECLQAYWVLIVRLQH